MLKIPNLKAKTLVSPLMMVGVLLVLLPIFAYMTLERMEKQKEHMRDQILVRGISLIRTFEAGTRTGMLTMSWGAQRIQAMLLETATQPDIAYLMITDAQGLILAHSDGQQVGSHYEAMPDLGPVNDEMQKVVSRIRQEEGVFEVYKRFVPLRMGFRGRHNHPPEVPGDPMGMHGGMHGGAYGRSGGYPDFSRMEAHYIFAGLSMEGMATMESRMAKEAISRGLIFFFLGCAGVIALFAFQAYRSARASLNRIKAFSDQVVQNMPSGLITLDLDFKITSANQAARSILGPLPDQADPRMVELAEEVRDKGCPKSRQIILEKEGSGTLNLDMSASLVQGEDDQAQGYIFLFRDLTQLVDLRREVETNRRLAAIGKLAGGVAHEIRNPLSSIKGFATYFSKRYESNPEDAMTAQIMVQEVERINRSITQLLEFANPMAVEKRTVEIAPLIQHSLMLLSHDLDRKKIASRMEILTREKQMVTDPDRITQVLLNLYMNAVNAMESGGLLEVQVRDLDGGQDPGIEIRVRDNGVGIAPQHLESIFDPYFTTRPEGTGLGLAIVHRIVENLKGEIFVESEPGKGTCFVIALPGAALKAEPLPDKERRDP